MKLEFANTGLLKSSRNMLGDAWIFVYTGICASLSLSVALSLYVFLCIYISFSPSLYLSPYMHALCTRFSKSRIKLNGQSFTLAFPCQVDILQWLESRIMHTKWFWGRSHRLTDVTIVLIEHGCCRTSWAAISKHTKTQTSTTKGGWIIIDILPAFVTTRLGVAMCLVLYTS